MRTHPLGPRGTMIASCLNFLALGVITAGLGPALPDLAAHTGVSLAAVGAVLTGLFSGAVATLSIAGLLSDRFGQRPLLFAGAAILMLGTVGIILSPSLPLLVLAAVLAGLGHGFIDLATNLVIAEVFAHRSTAALNLVNVFFAVGAVAGPFVASLTLRWWGSALPALWLGALLFLPQLWLAPRLAGTPRGASGPAPVSRSLVGRLLRSPLLWLFALTGLIYVGGEAGVGSWNTVYLTRTTALDPSTAALLTAGYWLALTLGRVAAAAVGTRFSAQTILAASLTGALAGAGLLLVGVGRLPLTLAGVLLAGFCFGPVFPTLLSVVTLRFREGTGTAASVIVGLGSAGGALIPALDGYLLDRVSPTAFVAVVATGTALLLLLFVAQTLLARRLRA